MNTMNKIIASLLLCFSVALAAANPNEDNKFRELFNKAQALNTIMVEWNEACGGQQELSEADQSTCAGVKVGIAAAFADWVSEAAEYKPVGDPKDCQTIMKGKVIAITKKIFQWNMKYAGRAGLTPEEAGARDFELQTDLLEKDKIQHELNECLDVSKLQSI